MTDPFETTARDYEAAATELEVAAEHYAGGTQTPASEQSDGADPIENALIEDEETTIDCYM